MVKQQKLKAELVDIGPDSLYSGRIMQKHKVK